ncbi:sugar ABC transporter ATP-binding protein [Arthrobacter sp. CC3]|uniref:sugar ABC transporter ATP-binding protein n=1 Tax=Arthrobacter sp. CC3 TaxID=3029185 RepID=UPI0032660EA9
MTRPQELAAPIMTPIVSGVRIRHLSKTFGAVRALQQVSFDIEPGEIHALCGGNGSGKSTLIKILSGIHQAEPGGLLTVDGNKVDPRHLKPESARVLGIRTIHQDLGIFPDLNVGENIAMGSAYPTRGGRIKWGAVRSKARHLIDRFDIQAAPSTILGDVSRVTQTQVAIARVLQDDIQSARGLLILDEPTASLPIHEVHMLLESLRRYAKAGQSILYVSHRLDEVLELADRVSILRDGQYRGTWDAADLDEHQLTQLIAGRTVERIVRDKSSSKADDIVAELIGVTAGPVEDANLTVRAGEVLGLAGLQGSGRTEVLRVLFGDLPVEAGKVRLGGKEIHLSHPADAMNAGVALVPEDRARDAALIGLPIADNLAVSVIESYWDRLRIRTKSITSDSVSLGETFGIKINSVQDNIETLSGGNQQKVVLARWLRRNPRLLLLDEPTQGVDVGARADIYKLIDDAACKGAAVIVVASDLEELALVSDRALILRRGRISAEVAGENLTAANLSKLIYGKGEPN